jgi:hypothetical protein
MNKNISQTTSYKTSQNLERLNKISDKLNNIHVIMINIDEYRI